MSWGSFIGACINTVAFAALWVVGGKVVEVITRAFNHTITIIPSFQDAVTGFNIQQQIWIGIMVIIFLGIWINYIANNSAHSNMVT